MIMRKKGKLTGGGELMIEATFKYCPHFGDTPCGTWCAQFDTIVDNGGREIVGAYLGCIDKQWVFKK